MSGKKLKLNLDSQFSGNDSSVDGSVIDINVDLESSEDDIDTDDDCHSSNFYEQRDMSYYVLIDLSILEEVIDLVGKCPAKNCRGKVKIQNNFSKKTMGLFCKLEFLCTVRHVIGKATFSPAKKFLTLKLMISTYVRSLFFVKLEKDTLVLNYCALYLILYHQ